MTIESLDFLYICLSVMIISFTIPITMILWRVYGMLERVERILNYVDHVRELAMQIEQIPMQFIEKILGKIK